MIKVSGPSHDPWGMLPFRVSYDEKVLPIFTRCCRPVKKDPNHLIAGPGISFQVLQDNLWH